MSFSFALEIKPKDTITYFIDSVIDSSRYFVLRIKDKATGTKSALIGIGFLERDPAFELKNCLNEYIRYIDRNNSSSNINIEVFICIPIFFYMLYII